ncbi:hypothetical protein HPB50_026632 [Hyalomma asiaticum]|uniref:Uncharacterized protein n=1 Tax=Hyalomma asiaticum TaxID=266040 RepID=A0ACB7T0B6_HYAAI|nr:hypothetical protein HPB50_026632 [Hyalomma asiaticum]
MAVVRKLISNASGRSQEHLRSNPSSSRRKWFKSTLVLVPLFGAHYAFLLGMSLAAAGDLLELVWLYVDQLFSSFQGYSSDRLATTQHVHSFGGAAFHFSFGGVLRNVPDQAQKLRGRPFSLNCKFRATSQYIVQIFRYCGPTEKVKQLLAPRRVVSNPTECPGGSPGSTKTPRWDLGLTCGSSGGRTRAQQGAFFSHPAVLRHLCATEMSVNCEAASVVTETQGCAEGTTADMDTCTPTHKEPSTSGSGKRPIDASSPASAASVAPTTSKRSCVAPNDEFSAFRASGSVYKATVKPLACFDAASFSNRALQQALNFCLKTSNFQGLAIHKSTNTVSVWVRSLQDVDRLRTLQAVATAEDKTVPVQAYLTPGTDLRRYVVTGVDMGESPEELVKCITCASHQVGFVVAQLYCFFNGEVQTELRKLIQRWRCDRRGPGERQLQHRHSLFTQSVTFFSKGQSSIQSFHSMDRTKSPSPNLVSNAARVDSDDGGTPVSQRNGGTPEEKLLEKESCL